MTEAYVPMPFARGWVLERHLGWRVIAEEPSLKVLRRRRGPFWQFLVLTRGEIDGAAGAAVLGRAGPVRWLSSIVWNDFDDQSAAESRTLAGCHLRRAHGPRWFGVGTFVVDLSAAEAELFGRMASRERNACRRAQSIGGRQELVKQPDTSHIGEFLALHAPMARERGLEIPRADVLLRMSAASDLWCVRSVGPEGRTWVVNLVYRQGANALFLHGARHPDAPGWAGAAAQWTTIRELRREGARWYDLGLVASQDEDDGIYRFKSALGGSFVSHGSEYRYVAPLVRLVAGVRARAAHP